MFKPFDFFVLRECMQILTVGTLSIVGIFFGTVEFKRAIELMGDFGMAPLTVLQVMVLQIPTGATYCLPAGVVISTILVLIRMQRDSEILALQACGISFARIMRPFLIMGLVGSLAVYSISEFIAPQLRYISSKLLVIGICKSDRPFPNKWRVEMRNPKDEMTQLLVLGRGEGRIIHNFLMWDFTKPKTAQMVWADTAFWNDGAWDLRNGRIFELLKEDDHGVKGVFGHMTFGDAFAKMWEELEKGPMDKLDKTTAQIQAEIAQFEAKHEPVPGYLMVQLYRRFSQPLNCLLLVLAGAPVAFMQSRRKSTLALGYAGILIACFFALQQTCISFGEHGVISPLLAAWLPATFLCAVGLSLAVIIYNKNRITIAGGSRSVSQSARSASARQTRRQYRRLEEYDQEDDYDYDEPIAAAPRRQSQPTMRKQQRY